MDILPAGLSFERLTRLHSLQISGLPNRSEDDKYEIVPQILRLTNLTVLDYRLGRVHCMPVQFFKICAQSGSYLLYTFIAGEDHPEALFQLTNLTCLGISYNCRSTDIAELGAADLIGLTSMTRLQHLRISMHVRTLTHLVRAC